MKINKIRTNIKGKFNRKFSKRIYNIFACALLSISILTYNVSATTAVANAGRTTFGQGQVNWLWSGVVDSTAYSPVSINGNQVNFTTGYGGYIWLHIDLTKEYSTIAIAITINGSTGNITGFDVISVGAQITSISGKVITINMRKSQNCDVYILDTNANLTSISTLSNITGVSVTSSSVTDTNTDNYYLSQIVAQTDGLESTANTISSKLTNIDSTVSNISTMLSNIQQSISTIEQSVYNIDLNVDDIMGNTNTMINKLDSIITALNNLENNYSDDDDIYINITDLFQNTNSMLIDSKDGDFFDLVDEISDLDLSPLEESRDFVSFIYDRVISYPQGFEEIRYAIIISILLVFVGWIL